MRLDLFLKLTRLIKQRTLAKQACDAGGVTVNGEVAKPGTAVQVGDELRIDLPAMFVAATVLEVPRNTNVPRKNIDRYVRVEERQTRDPHTYVFGVEGADAPGDSETSEDPPESTS